MTRNWTRSNVILSPNLDYHLAARRSVRRRLRELLHVRLRLTHYSRHRTGRCDRLSRVFTDALALKPSELDFPCWHFADMRMVLSDVRFGGDNVAKLFSALKLGTL